MMSAAERSVLILEDERPIANLLQHLVEELDCRVVGPAGRLSEAMDLLAAQRVDAAILDFNISGVPSDAVADELTRRGIPFLFITAYEAADIDPRHASPILIKPFGSTALQDMLASLLEGSTLSAG